LEKSYTEQYVKPFTFEIAGTSVSIKQKFYDSPQTIGWTVWDGSIVLSKYLEKQFSKNYFQNKRIIELGAGCGLVGIVAGLLGAEVVLTDMQSVLLQLQENVNLNIPSSSSNPSKVTVQQLTWGEDVRHFNPPFDMIISADVIYQCMEVESLISSLVDLSDQNTIILIAYESHDQITPKNFQQQVQKKFHMKIIPVEELDAVYHKGTITMIQLQKM